MAETTNDCDLPGRRVTGSLDDRRLATAARQLADTDSRLAVIYEAHGPPPLWARAPGFDTLIRIILEQQVSLASAHAVYRRARDVIGDLGPANLITAGDARLRAAGLTRQKSAYWLNAARAVTSGALPIDRLSRLEDDAVGTLLVSVKGIGDWTAQVYLLMALLRPDAWPAGDLALATATERLMGLDHRPDTRELARLADPWRPWRAVAARMLWQSYLAERSSG